MRITLVRTLDPAYDSEPGTRAGVVVEADNLFDLQLACVTEIMNDRKWFIECNLEGQINYTGSQESTDPRMWAWELVWKDTADPKCDWSQTDLYRTCEFDDADGEVK